MSRTRNDKPVRAVDCKPVQIRLPESDYRRLRVLAATNNQSMAAWIEEIVLPALSGRGGDHAPTIAT